MSHVATVAIVIKDLTALKLACKTVGLEFKENQKTYKWYGTWVDDYNGNNAAYKSGIKPEDYGKCDHAISVPNNSEAYEIGLVKRKDGKGYNLVWDFWSGGYGLETLAGKDCSKVVQNYSLEVAKKEMISKGYSVGKTTIDANGELEVEYTYY